jgi:23S rRNA pseudouridine1911/1915/1917 synthase
VAHRTRLEGRLGVIHTIDEDLDGERVDRAIAVLGGISRSLARSIVDAGGVRIGGAPVAEAKARVTEGDVIEFEIPEAEELLTPHAVEYRTVHQDDHLLVVDKPAGLTVHPGAGTGDETLAAGLLYDHPSIEGVGQPGRWGIVHRLDRATSGLLIVALSPDAYEALSAMMRAREVTRRYIALVDGVMNIPRGTVDAPIGPDPKRPTRRALSPYGKHAVTHYRQRSSWPDAGVGMLDVDLETGRTHQIRVHLAAIGHPVLADRVYGGRSTIEIPGTTEPIRVSRLALHAAHLEFVHPITGVDMAFDSELPADLADVVTSLGTQVPGQGG